MTILLLAATALVALGSAAPAADAVADVTPVWQVDVTQDSVLPQVHVVVNAFADPRHAGTFPLRDLPVKVKVDRSKMVGGRFSLDISMKVARLAVGPDGRLATRPLSFTRSNEISVNMWTGQMTALAQLSSDSSKSATALPESAGTLLVDMRAAAHEELYGWEESPDRSWGLVHTSAGTGVFKRGTPLPRLWLNDRIYDGQFSRDGSRYAAVADAGNLRRWILLSSEGMVLREGAPTGSSLSQLYLSPDGKALTFERQGRTVSVNLHTGTEAAFPVRIEGTRYYSADGRTMLDLTPYPGRLQLCDLTDPLNPVAVTKPLETTDAHFITAALSADGSLVAVEMLESEDNPHSNLLRVVVFDRSLTQRAVLLRRTMIRGLQFEGRHLFVGVQRHPIPVYFDFDPTTEIRLYDLTSL